MIQVVVTILVVIWFVRSARRVGEPAVKWGIFGFLAILVPSLIWAVIWSVALAGPILTLAMQSENALDMLNFNICPGFDDPEAFLNAMDDCVTWAGLGVRGLFLLSISAGSLIGLVVAIMIHRRHLRPV